MLAQILIGTLLGFLSGLGTGGGSLLILWLTVIRNIDPATARGINLLFFLPCALVAIGFRLKQGSVPVPKIFPAIVGGSATALVVSVISSTIQVSFLKKLFGGLLIFTGIREILFKEQQKGGA